MTNMVKKFFKKVNSRTEFLNILLSIIHFIYQFMPISISGEYPWARARIANLDLWAFVCVLIYSHVT